MGKALSLQTSLISLKSQYSNSSPRKYDNGRGARRERRRERKVRGSLTLPKSLGGFLNDNRARHLLVRVPSPTGSYFKMLLLALLNHTNPVYRTEGTNGMEGGGKVHILRSAIDVAAHARNARAPITDLPGRPTDRPKNYNRRGRRDI